MFVTFRPLANELTQSWLALHNSLYFSVWQCMHWHSGAQVVMRPTSWLRRNSSSSLCNRLKYGCRSTDEMFQKLILLLKIKKKNKIIKTRKCPMVKTNTDNHCVAFCTAGWKGTMVGHGGLLTATEQVGNVIWHIMRRICCYYI